MFFRWLYAFYKLPENLWKSSEIFGNFWKTSETVQQCFPDIFMILKILGKSSEIFGSVQKSSKIFGKLRKRLLSVFQIFFITSWYNVHSKGTLLHLKDRFVHAWSYISRLCLHTAPAKIVTSYWLLDWEFSLIVLYHHFSIAHVQLKPKLALPSGNFIYLNNLKMIENIFKGYGNFSN